MRGRERLKREITQGTKQMEETEERTENRPCTDTEVESAQSRQKKGQMKSISLSDSDEEAIVEFFRQNVDSHKIQIQAEEGGTLGKTSSFQEFISQHCEEVVQDSTYQIWQAHSHEVRTSCSEEH